MYQEFLKQEYGLTQKSSFIQNAKDLDSEILQNPNFPALYDKLFTDEYAHELVLKALGDAHGSPGSEIEEFYKILLMSHTQPIDYLKKRFKRIFQIWAETSKNSHTHNI